MRTPTRTYTGFETGEPKTASEALKCETKWLMGFLRRRKGAIVRIWVEKLADTAAF